MRSIVYECSVHYMESGFQAFCNHRSRIRHRRMHGASRLTLIVVECIAMDNFMLVDILVSQYLLSFSYLGI